jgi:hypothetical protein
MFLKAPDYAFIGVKLKGLIFSESGKMAARDPEYALLGKEDCERKSSMAANQL